MAGAGDGGFLSVSLSITGQDIEQKFATWGTSISNLEPAFEQIAGDLMGDFAQNMVREGGFFGGARSLSGGDWAPLRPATVRERERLGYGGEHPILWRTGLLGHSLAERGAPGNIYDVGPDHVTVGTNVEYAGYHQEGTRKMVARTIVGVNWARRSLIVRRIGDYVRAMAAKAGL